MSAVLQRATFRTSRLLDFASSKELVAQTGHQVDEWLYVIVKELVDNAIDACEEAGIAPDISIAIDQDGIEVADNGPGIPPETVKGVLDFGVRVSSREAYVSPTRGAQGNALKTLVAMPFVLSGDRGCLQIEARGLLHTIVMGVNNIRQAPTIRHDTVPGKDQGTRVRLHLNPAGSIGLEGDARFLLFVEGFTWLNPHLSLTLDYFGHRTTIGRTTDTWPKWKPSEPTSPHWYTPERFGRLIAAYITDDADKGRQRTVGEFVGEFAGLSGSAKKKAILEATGLFRAQLSALATDTDLDKATIAKLLMAMQSHSKPLPPERLGIIGKEHFRTKLERMDCRMESFRYQCIRDTSVGLPWVIEAAFAWRPGSENAGKSLITGINWSPAIKNPFRDIIGRSLDSLLSDQWIDDEEPVMVALHMACASVEYTDRGKSAIALPYKPAAAVKDAVESVTEKWAKQRKREEREARARQNREHMLGRRDHVNIKEAAWQEMEAAYLKASAGGTLPAHARQIMYAARPQIQALTDRKLDDAYFTQNLLPTYIEEKGVDWNVVYDARGHFTEPHTDTSIPLGTLQVRQHLTDIERHEVDDDPENVINVFDGCYPTLGPKNRYGAILFIEKEGFMPLFEAVHLAERYDIAIMSTKGMSVTASRVLVDKLCGRHAIPLFVLHDFDVSGFSIFGTLAGDTKRYQFANNIRVIDLGLRLDDIDGLESETVSISSPDKTKDTLRRHGASEHECDFLMRRRVELNALPSDALIEFIERKLTTHGVAKVVPDDEVLAAAYRRMRRQALVQQRINEALEEFDGEEANRLDVPVDLRARIKEAHDNNSGLRWDSILSGIASEDHETENAAQPR